MEKKQLSPDEYSPARKEAELEKEQKQKEMEGNNMVNQKKAKPKKEKKPLNKSEVIKDWNTKNKNYSIDTKTQTVNLPDSVKIEKLTEAINIIRRLRTLLKKLDYKTSSKPGKYT